MEFFSEFGLNTVSIVIVVIAVQSLKRKTSLADWVYIAATAVITAVAQLLVADFTQGWQSVANSVFINSLAAAGAYSYAKRIPIINRFINDGTDDQGGDPEIPRKED